MRKFDISCRDALTGYEMILSECSYNMACDWLSQELDKLGMEVYQCAYNGSTDMYELNTRDNECVPGRKFYYDETRGYLLGE